MARVWAGARPRQKSDDDAADGLRYLGDDEVAKREPEEAEGVVSNVKPVGQRVALGSDCFDVTWGMTWKT